MGIRLTTLFMLLFSTSSVFAANPQTTHFRDGKLLFSEAPLSSPMTAGSTSSLDTYLQYAYDRENLKVEKSVLQDDACGPAYFLDFKVKSFWNFVQVSMDYYVQTLTPESQDRLYQAIKTNYHQKGLPKCLLQDQFYTPQGDGLIVYNYKYNPDFTTVLVPVQVIPVPAGNPCAGMYSRPLTSCWNVVNPYGD